MALDKRIEKQTQQDLEWVADHESSALKWLNNRPTLQQVLFPELHRTSDQPAASMTSKISSCQG